MKKSGIESMSFSEPDAKVAEILVAKLKSRNRRLGQAGFFDACVRGGQGDPSCTVGEVIAVADLRFKCAHKCAGVQKEAVGRAADCSFNFDISPWRNAQRNVRVSHSFVPGTGQRQTRTLAGKKYLERLVVDQSSPS